MDRQLPAMLIFVLVCIAGCNQSAPSVISVNWGAAYKQAREGQMVNPEVENKQEPVVGMDGHAAATNMDMYRKSFESPKQDLGRSVVSSGVGTR